MREELVETLKAEFSDVLTEDARVYTGDGWLALIREGLVLVRAHGGRVDCIKQKLGFLRIEFFGDGGSKDGWQALFDGLQRISERCKKVCEVCGDAGVLRNSGGYIHVACDVHAEPEQNDSSF